MGLETQEDTLKILMQINTEVLEMKDETQDKQESNMDMKKMLRLILSHKKEVSQSTWETLVKTQQLWEELLSSEMYDLTLLI